MKVLIVSAWDPRSGVLSVFRSLERHLRTEGVRFSAFSFDGWGEDTRWTFCDELVDGRTETLTAVLNRGNYDVLHCVDTTYSPPYDVEKWVRRARFRGGLLLMAQVASRELTRRANATRYVACSEDAAELLELDAHLPVEVIPNGYDESVFFPQPVPYAERPVLIWVGRSYDPQKDVELFFDVLDELPEYDAVLVDSAPLGERVLDRAGSFGERLQVRVDLAPCGVADVYRLGASSGGAILSTSRYEGMTIALLEAMACGCPVVAPRISGHGHLVHGRNALVFDRHVGPASIGQLIRDCRAEDVRSPLVGSALREVNDRFTSQLMARKYLEVYERSLRDVAAEATNMRRLKDPIARSVWRAGLAIRRPLQLARAKWRAGQGR